MKHHLKKLQEISQSKTDSKNNGVPHINETKEIEKNLQLKK